MNKASMIDKIAEDAGITKTAVTLVGFGTFTATERKARTGRNPHTGATLQIPAKRIVRFRASKELEETMNP